MMGKVYNATVVKDDIVEYLILQALVDTISHKDLPGLGMQDWNYVRASRPLSSSAM